MKRQRILWLSCLTIVALMSFMLAGCATTSTPTPAPTRIEGLLSQAGI